MKDTMAIFRRIIGYIARIDDCNLVKVEHIAQDIEIDIADLRVWLRLMESLNLIFFMSASDEVILRLMFLDAYGFDTGKLKDL